MSVPTNIVGAPNTPPREIAFSVVVLQRGLDLSAIGSSPSPRPGRNRQRQIANAAAVAGSLRGFAVSTHSAWNTPVR
jgi:hypothetical protein